uniref:Uncharacterized protein n=1 Tax=Solanum lycopersicum TaxID=4081 RepID=A0A3Q7FNE9_SOLLC
MHVELSLSTQRVHASGTDFLSLSVGLFNFHSLCLQFCSLCSSVCATSLLFQQSTVRVGSSKTV